MASSTPNINLTLPVGSEKVSRQVINDNNTKIDNAIGALPSGQNLQGEIESLNNKLTRTHLTTATDLNTLLALSTGNVYYSGNDLGMHSNIPSGSWSNSPFDLDSVMLGNGYTAQILRVYNSSVGPRTFTRQNYYTSSTPFPFTPWQEFVRRDDIGVVSTVDNTVNSVTSSTWTTISTLALGIGVYVITGDLWFTGNQSGIRIMILDTEESVVNSYDNSVLGTGRTDLNKTRILTLNAQTTMYLRAYQSSGTGLETKGRIRAIRIK